MLTTFLVVASTVCGGLRADPPPDPPKFFLIDLAPIDNLRKDPLTHLIRFVGTSAEDKRINFSAAFKADKMPTEVRDIAYERVKSVGLGVKKVGDTKLLLIGCKGLNLATETPTNRQFPENCQPILKSFDTEKDVLEEVSRMTPARPTMLARLALVTSVFAKEVAEPPGPPKFFVVDFTPAENLRKDKPSNLVWVRFVGINVKGRRVDFEAHFTNMTPTEARDRVFKYVDTSRVGVKKVGDTKLLITGCKSLDVVTTDVAKRPVAEQYRLTLKVFDSEEEALKAK